MTLNTDRRLALGWGVLLMAWGCSQTPPSEPIPQTAQEEAASLPAQQETAGPAAQKEIEQQMPDQLEPLNPLSAVRQEISEGRGVLVDVRSDEEWDAGHIEGAIFLPLMELLDGMTKEELATQLPQDKVLYTYCVKGVRAQTAAEVLQEHGYKVQSLKPGYKELVEAGF